MPFVFLLFVIIPVVEIWVLIEVGSKIGVFNTIALVVLTAVVGTAMLRAQGLAVLTRVRTQMAANQLPAVEMIEGILLVVGGALLLTPGFVTDTFGFLCLIPQTRSAFARATASRFSVQGFAAGQTAQTHTRHERSARQSVNHTIEGEYHREDDY